MASARQHDAAETLILHSTIETAAARETITAKRHSESESMLDYYRKELDDARKATPDLDAPLH